MALRLSEGTVNCAPASRHARGPRTGPVLDDCVGMTRGLAPAEAGLREAETPAWRPASGGCAVVVDLQVTSTCAFAAATRPPIRTPAESDKLRSRGGADVCRHGADRA